jgi:hypothetical protein
LGEQDVRLVLSFFDQIARYGSLAQHEGVFGLTEVIINHFAAAVLSFPEVASIAHSAAIDWGSHGSAVVRSLLRKLVGCGITTRTTKRVPGKTFSLFPEMPIKVDVTKWEPIGENVFSNYHNFPPLFMTDTGFAGSQVLKNVMAFIDAIPEVPPLSEWYRSLPIMSRSNREPLAVFVPPDEEVMAEFFAKMDLLAN